MKKRGLIIALLIAPLFLGFNNNLKNNSLKMKTVEFSNTVKFSKLTEFIKPSDQYYTGASKVSGQYQNIVYNHIGNIESVWDKYTGENVTIAIIDSGIDTNHPDFKNLLDQCRIDSRSAYFAVENSKIVKHVGIQYLAPKQKGQSYDSHGTAVAGVATASINNLGIVGVAPEANILIIKIDMYTAVINKAISYAVDCGADVINMSIGAYAEPYGPNQEEGVDYFPDCKTDMVQGINYAYDHNVIVVAAGGNDSTSVNTYPAANKHVIGVGALKLYSSTLLADYSNFNKDTAKMGDDCNVDIVAPGSVVTTSYNGESTYSFSEGTSFSSPIVAGAAALWKEKYPKGTPDKFMNDLYTSATDIQGFGWDVKTGYGALNVYSLLTDFNVDSVDVSLNINGTHQIVPTTKKKSDVVTYESLDPTIATVSDKGLIIGISHGETYVKASCNGDEKFIRVAVSNKVEPPPAKKRCGGTIITSSMVISIVSIAFISLLIIKKKKEQN